MMEILFWCATVGAIYSYVLYPISLLLLPRRSVRQRNQGPGLKVSVIITAYNEESRIERKIVDTLAIDYPEDKIEIIIASDASSDRTDDIVCGYRDKGVRLIRAEARRGKEYVQSLAIKETKGEILVFSDVGTFIPPDSITKIAKSFADPKVGAVSSEDRLTGREGQAVGEGLYVRYEMWLRRLESAVNTLVGLSGSFFAAKKEICQEWDTEVPSDLNTALNAVRYGYLAITDPEILGYYADIADEKREYQRKFRTVLRGLTGILRYPKFLNPLAYGLFAYQLWSHKIMRWLVPWFLLLALVSSAVLATSHWLYLLALIGQILIYSLALVGLLSTALRASAFIKVPFFFVQANIAIAHATIAFLLGRKITMWQPSKR